MLLRCCFIWTSIALRTPPLHESLNELLGFFSLSNEPDVRRSRTSRRYAFSSLCDRRISSRSATFSSRNAANCFITAGSPASDLAASDCESLAAGCSSRREGSPPVKELLRRPAFDRPCTPGAAAVASAAAAAPAAAKHEVVKAQSAAFGSEITSLIRRFSSFDALWRVPSGFQVISAIDLRRVKLDSSRVSLSVTSLSIWYTLVFCSACSACSRERSLISRHLRCNEPESPPSTSFIEPCNHKMRRQMPQPCASGIKLMRG